MTTPSKTFFQMSPAEKRAAANADPTLSPWWVSVLYADYGKRKTTTACSMVKEKGLLLSSDDSWKVLRNTRHKELFDKMRIVKLESLVQLDYIELQVDDRDGKPYDTIIWDTASKSVDKYLDVLTDQTDWGSKSYRDTINSKHPEIKGGQILGPMDYRFTRDHIRPILERLFAQEAHIIFTSQMTIPIPGLGKNQQMRPSIPDATFKIIGERADIIAQLLPGNRGSFLADVSENSASILGKSRIETIQGRLDLDTFVKNYKEHVF